MQGDTALADPGNARRLPPQTMTTIGDTLSRKQISWAWYAGSWNRAGGRSVIRAVPREDFWAPGHGPGELDRIFIGLGAAQREEHLVQVPGHQLGEFLAQ